MRRPNSISEEEKLRRGEADQEAHERRVALRLKLRDASRADHQDAATQRVSMVALRLAKAKHAGTCRGVLGQLPTAGDGLQFECCDCHEVVSVSSLEASL